MLRIGVLNDMSSVYADFQGPGSVIAAQSVPPPRLQTAQGTTAIAAFYWDQNDGTRAWSTKFQERHAKKLMPNEMHAESKGPWDLLKITGTVAADKAFRPMSEGGCPLVK